MRALYKTLVFALLLTCSACGKADISDARRDHILAADHGWIDLTVSMPARDSAQKLDKPCFLNFMLNDESRLSESASLGQVAENTAQMGYRFPAPAGALRAELVFSLCVKDTRTFKLPITLPKDHLAKLQCDGKTLSVLEISTYEPTTLEWVRAEIVKLQSNQQTTDKMLSTLTWLALSSLVLNLIMFIFIIRSRRNV